MLRNVLVGIIASALLLSSFGGTVGAADQASVPAVAATGITIKSIVPSVSSPQPVGTSVTWTASATGPGALEYQFSVQHGTASPTVVQDFGSANSFTYVDIQEERYAVVVAVQLVSSPGTSVSRTSTPFSLTSRVTSTSPVATATSNPLVALFSGPPCASGSTVVASFFPATNSAAAVSTPSQACNGKSVNVYIAGMYPNTRYQMQEVITTGTTVTRSPRVSFKTGTPSLTFPTYSLPLPPNSQTSTADGIQFLDSADTKFPYATATDLSGNVVWYLDPATYPNFGPADAYVNHPVEGGTVLLLLGDSMTNTMTLREVDLAGNTLRQTTVGRINEQLRARGALQIDSLSHEVVRFPNGHTLTDGYVEKLYPPGTQGSTGPNQVDVLSDEIIDLDQNLQVVWTWNPYEWLDINRPAVLGETCVAGQTGCPIPGPRLAPIANDWTHGNAIAFSPNDNDILFSMRHQDWIIKIDYNNGTGTGAIVWRLGLGGDFTINDPGNSSYPWFSHQHGIENDVGPPLDRLDTFDDGNTRCDRTNDCESRGQVYALDEVNKIATLQLNAYVGNYSGALGWAQTLANGNYSFTSGFLGSLPQGYYGQSIEIQPTSEAGTINYVLQQQVLLYRAYRMLSMYSY
jgi:hypothetical protein